jgi:hypothetical protein
MGMKSLLKNNVITQEVGYFAAGQVAKSSAVLDMAGFDWACAIASYGTLLATGTLVLAAFGGDTSAAAATAYTAASVSYTVPATPISGINQILEVCRPTKRYIKFTMTPGVANAVICCMIVLRGKGVMPTTQLAVTTGTLSSLLVVTPV